MRVYTVVQFVTRDCICRDINDRYRQQACKCYRRISREAGKSQVLENACVQKKTHSRNENLTFTSMEYLHHCKHSLKILCKSKHFPGRYRAKSEWVFFLNTVYKRGHFVRTENASTEDANTSSQVWKTQVCDLRFPYSRIPPASAYVSRTCIFSLFVLISMISALAASVVWKLWTLSRSWRTVCKSCCLTKATSKMTLVLRFRFAILTSCHFFIKSLVSADPACDNDTP